ncbi:MAG: hypothetical protein IPL62_15370 [Caulobacteraceae bacterium]|nr:hypothetical protein [Caulobacteraceae bacterium]
MRVVLAILACLVVAQCASAEDKRFRVGEAPTAYVIIGVAEAAENTSPSYTVLWRRLDANGAFMRYGARRIFEARSESGDGVQVPGIPGEFILSEIEPGTYALDSVFALVRDGRVNYSANGVVHGPERPTFEVRPGEAVYLGIWQANLVEVSAVTSQWRGEQSDLDAVLRAVDPVVGDVRMARIETRAVACAPYRIRANSQRQVC